MGSKQLNTLCQYVLAFSVLAILSMPPAKARAAMSGWIGARVDVMNERRCKWTPHGELCDWVRTQTTKVPPQH